MTALKSKRVTSTYMFPYKEDLCRFDFEVRDEDEYMCNVGKLFGLKETGGGNIHKGIDTPIESDKSDTDERVQ